MGGDVLSCACIPTASHPLSLQFSLISLLLRCLCRGEILLRLALQHRTKLKRDADEISPFIQILQTAFRELGNKYKCSSETLQLGNAEGTHVYSNALRKEL